MTDDPRQSRPTPPAGRWHVPHTRMIPASAVVCRSLLLEPCGPSTRNPAPAHPAVKIESCHHVARMSTQRFLPNPRKSPCG